MKRLPDAERLVRNAEIARRVAAGETFVSVGAAFDIDPTTARTICDQLGVKSARTHAPHRRRAAAFAGRTAAHARQQERARAEMTGPQAEAYLDRAVAFECAPAWVRHPQPTT